MVNKTSKRVTVYVEGGSRGERKNEAANIEFRRAFAKLSEKLGIRFKPSFVPCGGRDQTFELAWAAFIDRSDDELVVMLVDGEDPSQFAPEECWRHLRERQGKHWQKLEERHKNYVFTMATCMETWLAADLEGLRGYFGSCLSDNPIKAWVDLESVSRKTVFAALQTATANCGHNRYDKGEFSFLALQCVDPRTVGEKCPHAKRLFENLPRLCERRRDLS